MTLTKVVQNRTLDVTRLHAYTPKGECKKLFASRQDEVVISGPAGTGKSRACLEKIHLMCLVNPGMKALIVRKTATSLGSTAMQTYKKHVAAELLTAGEIKFHGGNLQDPGQFRYTNGSTITVGGLDKATRIMSSEYDLIYVQEAIELTESDWEALTTRLRNHRVSFQQLIGDTNPDRPTHWLKVRSNNGKTVMLESRHEDNPTLFNDDNTKTPEGEAYIAKLDSLTGVRYSRLRKGLWVAAEGLVYDTYDPAVHLIDRFEIPWEWPRYWAVDFGYKNPFVCQMWAMDPDNRLYLYKEFYMTEKIVDWHANTILDNVKPKNEDGVREWKDPKPRRVITDHDAEGRETFSQVLGIPTEAADKRVSVGIQLVQKRMDPHQKGGARLFILRDSLVQRDIELVEAKKPACTEEEIAGYVWDQSPRFEDKPKEVPVKENDHGMDAKRYLVAHCDTQGVTKVRFA